MKDKLILRKTCYKCKAEKSVTEFHKNTKSKDGLHTYCKTCKKIMNIEYVKKWRESEEGKCLIIKKKRCKKCKRIKNRKKFNKNSYNKDRLCKWCKSCRSKYNLKNSSDKNKKSSYDKKHYLEIKKYKIIKKRYGLSKEAYHKLVDGKYFCQICNRKFSKNTKCSMVIDHDHNTGVVRDVVCRQCNLLIGCARDNINILISAIKYLKKFNGDLDA